MIEFDDIRAKRKVDLKIILVILLSFLFGIYIFNLLFGEKSFSRMLDLQKEYKILNKKVKDLKKENTTLQKEYFELKELEGK
ncbi:MULTISPECIES: FtsB family cell division protein [unclassified Lebetimonas]|uniref:FtsB family cell division protein n=1 Tax=unclassified Lebetimonas TaxID=2648158 RepID=UPI0004645F9B|nr:MULTISPECIES: septum formation initiator family protein [unclassified Lebetimonas]